MNKIIIIDGYSILFRAYYATAYKGEDTILKTSTGIPINAIFTFSNMVLPLLSNLNKNDTIFVALDSGKETKRHKEFAEYKANRPSCPESLKIQMPILRELLEAFNIPFFEQEGDEADDIAGSVAKMSNEHNYNVEIYTSDKDYLQLVNNKTSISLIKKGMKDIQKVNFDNFYNLYDMFPEQIKDYKGLRGDSSDNLKGIPGIGEKTAIALLKKYNNLENIINNAQEIGGKLSLKIIENKDSGILCKKLATIDVDLNLPFNFENILFKGIDFKKATNFLNKYEMKSLVNKISNIETEISKDEIIENFNFEEVSNIPEINDKEIGISLNYDYASNYHNCEISGFFISTKNANYYIKYGNAILDKNFKNILQCSDIKKDCFNYKAIGYILKKNNINLNGINCDLLLCSYLLNSNNSSDVKTTFLFFDKTDIDPKIDQFNSSLKISIYSRLLSNKILDDLKTKDDFNLYENIELPLSKCLLNMEYEGFPLNKQTLLSIAKNYQDKLDILTHDIYRLAGCEFNIDSPKQVSNLLFNVLQLKSNRKSSTSIDYLKYLVDEHPIVEKILSYRKYAKLLNTYVNGLLNYIGKDNKIHCIFNQAQTTTGRLSSSEPNMQNIAVRDEESKEIRKAFFYDNDLYCILSYDYSQIELRILASLSKCKNLINAFNSNIDIHTLTAQKIFNKTQITEQERRKAKAVNFGIVYGISDYGLKEQINVPLKEAKEIINKFYETYPEIKTYMQNQIEFATKNGYVKTLFNRKRFIEEINSPNYSKREFAKRAACNAPIQGSAADIIKIIMIKIDKLLENYDSKLVLQIHDELIFKINKNELEELKTKIKDIMENTIKLDVKLTVDGGYAKDWYSVK